MSKNLIHTLEGFAVALLAQAPALLSSQAVRDFVSSHPADAAFVPVAAGILSAAYRYLKAKRQAQVAVTPITLTTPVVPAPPPETKA